MKNPKWTREEIVITLSFYHKFYPSIPEKNSDEIKLISDLLRKLKDKSGVGADKTYRNHNGVYMKLMNFHHINPNHFGKGLHAASILDKEVFLEFLYDHKALDAQANKILDKLD